MDGGRGGGGGGMGRRARARRAVIFYGIVSHEPALRAMADWFFRSR